MNLHGPLGKRREEQQKPKQNSTFNDGLEDKEEMKHPVKHFTAHGGFTTHKMPMR